MFAEIDFGKSSFEIRAMRVTSFQAQKGRTLTSEVMHCNLQPGLVNPEGGERGERAERGESGGKGERSGRGKAGGKKGESGKAEKGERRKGEGGSGRRKRDRGNRLSKSEFATVDSSSQTLQSEQFEFVFFISCPVMRKLLRPDCRCNSSCSDRKMGWVCSDCNFGLLGRLLQSERLGLLGFQKLTFINSVQTRCIVKTSGSTRGVCKIGDLIKFKGFLVEFLENRSS